jgi:hypothetical protein
MLPSFTDNVNKLQFLYGKEPNLEMQTLLQAVSKPSLRNKHVIIH